MAFEIDDETGRLTYRCHMGIVLTSQDKLLYDDLIPSRGVEETTPFLEGNDRKTFLSFARQMLAWLPEERKTARELIDHPFLKLGG
ncbi:uncharacterized protein BO96DRAFT_75652 [Aspergillus niger CBS 101883]|uniref:uncharacterized protein n=1 Tax=Aspergillus lacticoffeatus (strain CBS 101883) TaxID=1450533 RepID=UPI000D805014|nr:uncharacterized protein BO96DRAFT_75652 [Aspergillus niger CBS 101883]PYH55430.1 hypothetical protein BO96DRAFT_75652 [Aspergillus niger CBS 101883]